MQNPKPSVPGYSDDMIEESFASDAYAQTAFDSARPTDVEELRPSGTQRVDVADTEPPRSRTPGLVRRQGGRLRRRLTIYLSPELAKRLAIHCASADLEMSEVVEQALANHLGG